MHCAQRADRPSLVWNSHGWPSTVPKLPADFPGFYAAAKLVWNTPTKLYAYEDQLARQKSIDNRIGDSILSWLEVVW
jgi:hypothetical protein